MHWGGLLLLAAGARVGWAGAVTGSSLNWGPFLGSFYKGAGLYWGPKTAP